MDSNIQTLIGRERKTWRTHHRRTSATGYSGEFLTEVMRSASRSIRALSSTSADKAARTGRISDTVDDSYDFRDRNPHIRKFEFHQACDTTTPTAAYYCNRMPYAMGRDIFALEERIDHSASGSRMWR